MLQNHPSKNLNPVITQLFSSSSYGRLSASTTKELGISTRGRPSNRWERSWYSSNYRLDFFIDGNLLWILKHFQDSNYMRVADLLGQPPHSLSWLQTYSASRHLPKIIAELIKVGFETTTIRLEESEDYQPIRIIIDSQGDAARAYETLSNFDYDYWLDVDPEVHDEIGVFLG